MKFVAFVVASAALSTSSLALAIDVAAPVAPAVVPVAPSTVAPIVATPKLTTATTNALPANTELWLSMNHELNSKKVKQGAKFDMTVARDVMLGDYVVIPRGSKARGQVTYRTGKGAFGKSAKMEFDISEVEVNGQFIPVNGHYRIEGAGNTGAAVGAVVAVGVFGAFVTGRSAIAAQGTEYKAFTANPVPVKLADAPAQPIAPGTTPAPSAAIPAATAPTAASGPSSAALPST
jgi:hypothetical protein